MKDMYPGTKSSADADILLVSRVFDSLQFYRHSPAFSGSSVGESYNKDPSLLLDQKIFVSFLEYI